MKGCPTLMSFVITRAERSTLELSHHVLLALRTFVEEMAATASAAQPGIAQDLKVINLHGEGSRKAPTVSTSCIFSFSRCLLENKQAASH